MIFNLTSGKYVLWDKNLAITFPFGGANKDSAYAIYILVQQHEVTKF